MYQSKIFIECSKGIKTTLDVGPVSDDTFKRHHCRRNMEENIEQTQIEKIFLRYRTYYQLLKSNVIGTNKTKIEPFESMKKTFILSRFVETMDESKRRKTSEIFKARELPENILVKSAQPNVKENLSKQKNIGILT